MLDRERVRTHSQPAWSRASGAVAAAHLKTTAAIAAGEDNGRQIYEYVAGRRGGYVDRRHGGDLAGPASSAPRGAPDDAGPFRRGRTLPSKVRTSRRVRLAPFGW